VKVIGIDPGSAQSAIVVFDGKHRTIDRHHLEPNAEAAQRVQNLRGLYPEAACVCELTRPFAIRGASGNAFFPVQLQDTAVWVGRFWERWGDGFETIDRRDVKRSLLGQHTGNDAMVRDAILDLFGGRQEAFGTKLLPGPLRGITRDRWAALAVALAWLDRQSEQKRLRAAATA